MTKNTLLISALVAIVMFSCKEDEEPGIKLSLGDFHQGGVIFYLDNTGEHGLICAIADQSFEAEWGCPNLGINGADGEEIGTGAQNTIDILDHCDEDGIAADLCDKYESGGFSDWFLPSIDELSLIELNKDIIDEAALANGGNELEDTEYWSSTEFNLNSVWVEHLLDGGPFGILKEGNERNVRAIRAF
jgi:hypothetical protein